ncbi:MAG: hypothetical protein JXR68_03235, partial [Bacteroidales bacterium]|nr:hypothetical protein [Bacteroidales bacterium]
MKKIFITIIISIFVTTGFSQYQAFKWYVGPGFLLDFSSTSIPAGNYPELGYSGLNISTATAIISDTNKNVALYLSNHNIFIPQATTSINAQAGYTGAPNQPSYFTGHQYYNDFFLETFSLLKPNAGDPYSIFYSSG